MPEIGQGLPGQTVNLGAAAMGPMPSPEGIMGQMGAAPPPPQTQMGSGMGAAAAQAFPSLSQVQMAPPGAVPMGNSGLGAAMAVPPPEAVPMGPPPSALQSAGAGNVAEQVALADYLDANRRKRVSKANPLRPIVEGAAQNFYGGGWLDVGGPFVPEPMAPLPRNEGETDEDYASRMQMFEEVDVREQKERYDRMVEGKVAEATTLGDVRDIGEEGHLGMAEAQLQAKEGVGGAQITQQQQVASAQAQAAAMSMDATRQAQEADFERRDFARQQRDAIQVSVEVRDEARKKLESLPDLDPQRVWKSKTGLGKFFAVIGAMAGGAIGSHAVPDKYAAIAAQSLEVQKANIGQAYDLAEGAADAVGQQVGLYRGLLDAAGSEGAADAMYMQLQLEDAQRLLEAQLAETTVPLMRQKLQESMVGLKGQIDSQQRIVDTAMATTPQNILRTVDPLGRRGRKRIEDRQDTLLEQQFELQKLGIGGEEKQLEREGKASAKQAEQARKELRGEGGVYKEAASLADKIAPKQALVKGIQDLRSDFLEQGIPGVGPFAATERATAFLGALTGETNKAREFEFRAKNMLRGSLRDESGAVLGDEEINEQFDLLMEGSEDIGGEEKVWQNFAAYEDRLNREIGVHAAGRSKEAQEYLTSNQALPERDATTLGQAPRGQVVRVK